MRAQSLVPILADLFDFPMETALRIDRGLCSAGMRVRGTGRSVPDMTRREALTFLLACMTTDKVTQAAEEVLAWLNAQGVPNRFPTIDPVEEEWEDFLEDTDTYKHFVEVNELLGTSQKDSAIVSLIDYLEVVCKLIESDKLILERVKLEIDFSDEVARIHYEHFHYRGLESSSEFFLKRKSAPYDLERHTRSTGIKRRCSVSGHTLYEIIQRT